MFGRPKNALHYVLYGALYLAMPVIVLTIFYFIDQPYQLSDNYEVSARDFVVSFDDRPPSDGWQALSKENQPVRDASSPYTSVWYRIENTRPAELSALYFPFPDSNLDIWHRGERLRLLGPMSLPLHYSRSPLSLPLAAQQTQQLDEAIYVRVARHHIGTYLPLTYIAPFDLTERDFAGQELLKKWLPIGMLCVMSVFVVFNFGLFSLNRKETAYGWYALTMLLWGMHTAHSLVDAIPFHHPLWFAFTYVLLLWIPVELIFVNRFFSLAAPRLEKVVVITSLLIAAILIAFSLQPRVEPMSMVAATLMTPWTVVCTVILTTRYFVALRSSWTFESVSLWLTSGAFFGVGIRDILFQYTPGGWTPPGNNYYLQYVALLPMLLFGWHLLRRYASALVTANLKNEQLDITVTERTAELESSYAKIAEESSRRSVAEERARLMRDMHDGLGGHLVHALALSEQGGDKELQKALRLALDDLRLVVDSLSPDQRGLPQLLATYRHRVSKMLSRTGTKVSWEIDEVREQQELGPKHALNLLRILQEAITNAVLHSGGDQIRVILSRVAEGVRLLVIDNGKGLRSDSSGRGITNMRTRAREMGAQLDIASTGKGTTVTCLLSTPARPVHS